MNEIILINISGEDKPGLTSSLTSILSSYGVNILDIGQAVIHETLSLGMVVEVPANSGGVFRDLLLKAHQLGVNVRFTPISEERYEKWVSGARQAALHRDAVGPKDYRGTNRAAHYQYRGSWVEHR
jgi:phosphoserine phosphatase